MVDFANLHGILKSGSPMYRKYHLSLSQQHSCKIPSTINPSASAAFKNAVKNLNVIELLESNTGLRKLTAVQKRHLECLVEGPNVYTPGQRLWRAGSTVDKAFIVVAGTVSFVPKRRHGGSAGKNLNKERNRVKQTHETNKSFTAGENLGETMRNDAVKAVRELQAVSSPVGRYFSDYLVYIDISYKLSPLHTPNRACPPRMKSRKILQQKMGIARVDLVLCPTH